MPSLTKLTSVAHSCCFTVLLKDASMLAAEREESLTHFCPPPTFRRETRDLNWRPSSLKLALTDRKHTWADTSMCQTIQLKCGLSTKQKFANLPPGIQQKTDRKSVQLFISFLPVPPQETVSAANGALQRLDSLESITDPHVVWPLTHLGTAIANTAVLSLTLKWSSTLSAAPRILKG